jgi:hypothetical protein
LLLQALGALAAGLLLLLLPWLLMRFHRDSHQQLPWLLEQMPRLLAALLAHCLPLLYHLLQLMP